MPGIGLGSTITGERSRLPSATTRSPPRHTQSLLQQFLPLPGAPEWEPIPDDPKTGWRAENRNLEKIFRMVASGFGCRGRHSVETRGEPSHRAPRRENEPPRSPPRHTQSLLQQFPPLPGAPEWEPIPDDPKTGWRAQDRNLEKIFRMVASGFGCRGLHSVETCGELSHRAPRREDEPPRDEAAEEDDVEDMDEDAAKEQGIIVYRRRAERDVIPPSSHHGSSGD